MRWGALLLLITAGTVIPFLIKSDPGFQNPDLARMVCFHLPLAFVATGYFFAMAWYGARYLKSRAAVWDAKCAGATEMAALLSVLVMATGILFSRVQWGAWWQWDPRQTSFLFVLLLLAAGLTLRASFSDPVRKALASSSYALFSLIPTLFLVFVYPRIVESFHPSDTVIERKFSGEYWLAIGVFFAGLIWLSVTIARQRFRAEMLERRSEEVLANVDVAGGDSAASHMVRPVSVSPKN